MNDCLETIKSYVPPIIRHILKLRPGEIYLAGGSIRSIFDHTPIADYDLFFKNEEAAVEAFHFACNKMPLAVTTDSPWSRNIVGFGVPIQFIIKKFFDSPEELIRQFDFTCCQWAFFANDAENVSLVVAKQTIQDTANRKINIADLSNASAEQLNIRIGKYISKGYSLSPKAMIACGEHSIKRELSPSF
jgi:hypothetical protein